MSFIHSFNKNNENNKIELEKNIEIEKLEEIILPTHLQSRIAKSSIQTNQIVLQHNTTKQNISQIRKVDISQYTKIIYNVLVQLSNIFYFPPYETWIKNPSAQYQLKLACNQTLTSIGYLLSFISYPIDVFTTEINWYSIENPILNGLIPGIEKDVNKILSEKNLILKISNSIDGYVQLNNYLLSANTIEEKYIQYGLQLFILIYDLSNDENMELFSVLKNNIEYELSRRNRLAEEEAEKRAEEDLKKEKEMLAKEREESEKAWQERRTKELNNIDVIFENAKTEILGSFKETLETIKKKYSAEFEHKKQMFINDQNEAIAKCKIKNYEEIEENVHEIKLSIEELKKNEVFLKTKMNEYKNLNKIILSFFENKKFQNNESIKIIKKEIEKIISTENQIFRQYPTIYQDYTPTNNITFGQILAEKHNFVDFDSKLFRP